MFNRVITACGASLGPCVVQQVEFRASKVACAIVIVSMYTTIKHTFQMKTFCFGPFTRMNLLVCQPTTNNNNKKAWKRLFACSFH